MDVLRGTEHSWSLYTGEIELEMHFGTIQDCSFNSSGLRIGLIVIWEAFFHNCESLI